MWVTVVTAADMAVIPGQVLTDAMRLSSKACCLNKSPPSSRYFFWHGGMLEAADVWLQAGSAAQLAPLAQQD